MPKFAIAQKKSKKLGLFALLFSVLMAASNYSFGEGIREPLEGEKVVTFDVTKMT